MGLLQKLLERYNKCIATGGDYFEGDKSFMCVLSIKVPIRKKSGNLSYAPRKIPFFGILCQSSFGSQFLGFVLFSVSPSCLEST